MPTTFTTNLMHTDQIFSVIVTTSISRFNVKQALITFIERFYAFNRSLTMNRKLFLHTELALRPFSGDYVRFCLAKSPLLNNLLSNEYSEINSILEFSPWFLSSKILKWLGYQFIIFAFLVGRI
jgi:hypothetical protein